MSVPFFVSSLCSVFSISSHCLSDLCVVSLVCLFVPCPTIKLTCPCLSLCVGYFLSYFNSLLSCVCYVHFCFPVSLVRFSSPVPCFPLLCLVFLIISCISTVDRDTGVLATKLTSSCLILPFGEKLYGQKWVQIGPNS